MIYKLIGSLTLILTGGYVALTVSRFERRRMAVLDAYISLIYYIKGQIDCYALPIGDILLRADPELLAACLGVDGEVPADIPRRFLEGGAPLPALVRESRLYLGPECERLLMTFAGELGHTFRAEQVARCDHYIAALGEERRRLCESLPARVRVSTALSLCAALGAAILLW